MGAHLLNGVKRSTTSRQLLRISHVEDPRRVSARPANRPERKEGEVAVSHVEILGAEQKARHHRGLGVTEHDHCVTKQRVIEYSFAVNTSSVWMIILYYYYSSVVFPAGALPGSLGQLSLPSPGVGKSSTSLPAGVKVGRVHLCRVAGNTV